MKHLGHPFPERRKLSLIWLSGLFCLVLASSAWAVEPSKVIWSQPSKISTDGDVQTEGALFGAWAFRESAAQAPIVINGVTFKQVVVPVNAPVKGSSGDLAYGPAFGVKTPVDGSVGGSPAYAELASQAISAPAPVSLTLSNLKENQSYQIQLWTTRSIKGLTTYSVADRRSPLMGSPDHQHIVGEFTTGAGETSVTIQIAGETAEAQPVLNALQVRAVPKLSWFRHDGYGLFVHWFPDVYDLPKASEGEGNARRASAALIREGETESEWSKTVRDFDVKAFAKQVSETGAGYVIFTNGQVNGYYIAPNETYEKATRDKPEHLAPGEFTPLRDLISDMSDALKPYGIKMFVYMAGEGPRAAPLLERPNGEKVYMPHIMHTSAGAAVSGELRTRYNAMISEWSKKWGDKVAGWWFDGCWAHETGYGDEWADNKDGMGNLNRLVAAAKSGNPDAIVATNPIADVFDPRTPKQDFITGELGRYPKGFGKFYEYPPTGPFLKFQGSDIQWHVTSYLGSWWGKPDLKYRDEELAMYINSVNKMGGVVSMDVAVNRNGQISEQQLNQLKQVKAYLKPSTAPAGKPQELPVHDNLALYRPAYLKDNNTGARLEPSKGYRLQPHSGVDNDPETFAQAGGKYAYSYIVDLESLQDFDQVDVTFLEKGFATRYEVKYSDASLAGPWKDLDSGKRFYKNDSGGLKTHKADGSKKGRWVMIRALSPNDQGQPGGQMAIEEFAVYDSKKPKTSATAKP